MNRNILDTLAMKIKSLIKRVLYLSLLLTSILLTIMCSFYFQALAQDAVQSEGIMLLVDNSGSIGYIDTDESGDINLDITVAEQWLMSVKEAILKNYIDNKNLDSIPIGLIEFGGDCETNLLVPLGTGNRQTLQNKLGEIKPQEYLDAQTPLSKAIIEAVSLLKDTTNPKIILYTDEGENCDQFVTPCSAIARIIDKILIPNGITEGLELVEIGFFPTRPISDNPNSSIENCIDDSEYKDYISFHYLTANDAEDLKQQSEKSVVIIDSFPPDPEPPNLCLKIWRFIQEFLALVLTIATILGGLGTWLTWRHLKRNNP